MLEVERHIFRPVRRVFREAGEDREVALVLLVAGVEPRVFEDAGLITDVQEIAIHAEGLLRAGLHGNLLLCAVVDHLLASWELRAEPLVPPRRDDLKLRRERGGGEFETHLIIALAGS